MPVSAILSSASMHDSLAAIALSSISAKPATDQFPPVLLMALRFTVAALLLVWFVPVPKGMSIF